MPESARDNPFGPGLLEFLRELDRNNQRAWFERHKERYEREVREPALEFIRRMAPRVEKISRFLVASDRKVGGSLMRIHRDVRFARDKRPYKTNLGIQFRHAAGKDVHAPGLYFHVDPVSVFLGVGIWHPEPAVLADLRAAIVAEPAKYRRALSCVGFERGFELEGESLRRVPRGFAADHPQAEALRRKDHIAVLHLAPKDLLRPDLPAFVGERFGWMRAYMAFLARALGLPF